MSTFVYLIFAIYFIAVAGLAYSVIKSLITGSVTGPRPMFYREKNQKTILTVTREKDSQQYWAAIFMRSFLLAALIFIGIYSLMAGM